MNIFELFGTIAINNEEANKAIDDTTSKAENAGEKSQGAFSKIGTAAAAVGKVVLTAGAALGTAWIAAIEGTREYRTHLGMLDTAFHNSGLSSSAARQAYSDLHAVLGDGGQATEAAQMLALVADNEKELMTSNIDAASQPRLSHIFNMFIIASVTILFLLLYAGFQSLTRFSYFCNSQIYNLFQLLPN